MILNKFIVFEGIDGSGTTSQINLLKDCEEYKNIIFTAEPSKSEIGKFLRQMLSGSVKFTNESAAFVFAADRNEHINGELKFNEDGTLCTGIKKACEKNNIVLSDRYLFSSLAYQSTNCDPILSKELNKFFPLPQLVFFFDIEAKAALERVCSRGESKEVYENLTFLEETVKQYRRVFKEFEENPEAKDMKIIYIDATKSKEEIHKIILENIKKYIF